MSRNVLEPEALRLQFQAPSHRLDWSSPSQAAPHPRSTSRHKMRKAKFQA